MTFVVGAGRFVSHGKDVRRVAPAIGLYFLAPLVAEFCLGDFPLTMLPLIVPFAAVYGGGALLIREVTRRAGRGWPTMLLLALAYGVLEEGLLTESLFNPNYLGYHLLGRGFVPALGIAVPWTVFVLTLHTVWSVSTPIALVEESTPERRTTPWLRTPGLVTTAVLFAFGVVFTFGGAYADGHFLASPAELGVTAAVVIALVVVAFRLPRVRERRPAPPLPPLYGEEPERRAPGPRAVFATAILAGVAFMLGRDAVPAWPGAVLMLVALAAAVGLTLAWSGRPGWGRWQRFALACGALLTYSWHAFTTSPVRAAAAPLVLATHVVFALAALGIVWFGVRRVRRGTDAPRTPWEVRFP
jgi:hypothetical protein